MSLLRTLYYTLPPAWRLIARRLVFWPADLFRMLRGPGNTPVPPRGLIHTGGGDFVKTGRTFFDYFIRFGGLQPHHHVLDVGCGIGRMALPLTGYLDAKGSYDGFDIVEQGVHWCKKHITPTYPHFRFVHVDLSNDLYKTSGGSAQGFEFPYASGQFDLVILTSVFMHMQPGEVRHYLDEINRVLKPGGRVCMTAFLINDISRTAMAGRAFSFRHKAKNCYLMDPRVPSANVAYEETEMDKMIAVAGFEIQRKFYGAWSGRKDNVLDFQDFIVLQK